MGLFRLCITVILVALVGNHGQAQLTPPDTLLHQRDSVIEVETDSTTLFFQSNEKIAAPAQSITKLYTTNRKSMTTLAAWLKREENMYADHVLADLDGDGKKELLLSNYTGGAHCCDELYIYKNIGPDKYQLVSKLTGGHTLINSQNEFEFFFDESFGYFFTCYACGYSDTSDTAPIPLRSVHLRYRNGMVKVVNGDAELKAIITDNLGKLAERPCEPLDSELSMDEGLRKEYAMNLLVYYFSFGRNLPSTNALFYKYYRHPDAKKVWSAFVQQLLPVRRMF